MNIDPLEKLKVTFDNKEPYQYTKISDYKYCQYCGSRQDKDHEDDCLYKCIGDFLRSY